MSASNNSQALPLCLPNNCSWDDRTRTYKQDKTKERRALYTVPYTLSRLRAIPGPVCVVSIAGPCRQGKSYIISKVFDQGGVFPLGHLMDPETMGIWVWIVPKKYVDSEGREFTLVLLDSEGTDAVKSNQVHDHSIFTLTVLLSSILIYNSQGVPTRSDLDNLDHIGKLSQRIQIMSSKSSRRAKVSPKKVLPLFIWLLRDVVLRLPPECNTFKEYLQQKVFTSNNQSTGGVAQDILEFFSGFDAFQLPRPSDDPDVLSNIHDATTQINPAFLRGVQKFKKILIKQLEPKRGFHDKELVTGEALALLVEEYVKTLNKPDAVPCIEGAWTLFVDQKFSIAASEAQQLYQIDMEKQFKEKLPCDDNLIRNQHQETLYECLQLFDSHVAGIAEANNNKYRKTFLEFAEKIENEWLRQNNKVTEMHCQDLLEALRVQILDPVLERLSGSEIARVSSEDLHSAYKSVEEEFKRRSEGPRSLCENYAAIFRMQAEDELQKHYQRLLLSKDYETKIQHERDARAREQEQIQQLKEETGELRRRREESEKKMEELIKKRDEDLKRMAELLSQRMEAQKAETQTRNTNMRAERERQSADMARLRQNLESSIGELDTAIKQKDAEIANLKSRL